MINPWKDLADRTERMYKEAVGNMKKFGAAMREMDNKPQKQRDRAAEESQ